MKTFCKHNMRQNKFACRPSVDSFFELAVRNDLQSGRTIIIISSTATHLLSSGDIKCLYNIKSLHRGPNCMNVGACDDVHTIIGPHSLKVHTLINSKSESQYNIFLYQYFLPQRFECWIINNHIQSMSSNNQLYLGIK